MGVAPARDPDGRSAIPTVLVTGCSTPLGAAVVAALRARGMRALPADTGLRVHGGAAPPHLQYAPPLIHVPPLDRPLPEADRAAAQLRHARLLAEAVAGGRIRKLVVASTSLVYPGGLTAIGVETAPAPALRLGRVLLGVEEILTTAACRAGTTAAVVRVPHVYGPGSPLFGYLARGVVPFAGRLDTVFSHLHVRDAASALVAALDAGDLTLPLGDSNPVSWRRFFGVAGRSRPGLLVVTSDPAAEARACSMLSPWKLVAPSSLAPGTGLGCSVEQRIASGPSWERLGMRPVYGSVATGIPAVLGSSPARGSWRRCRSGASMWDEATWSEGPGDDDGVVR